MRIFIQKNVGVWHDKVREDAAGGLMDEEQVMGLKRVEEGRTTVRSRSLGLTEVDFELCTCGQSSRRDCRRNPREKMFSGVENGCSIRDSKQ